MLSKSPLRTHNCRRLKNGNGCVLKYTFFLDLIIVSIEMVMFRIENDNKFALPVFEVGRVVVVGLVELWLLGFLEGGEIVEFLAGLTFEEIVETCGFFDRGSCSVPYRISDQL